MTPTKIQEAVLNSGGNASATTYIVSLTGVTAGHSLILFAVVTPHDYNTPPAMTAGDNVTGTWVSGPSYQAAGGGSLAIEIKVFQCVSSPGGSVTVTVTSATAGDTTGVALWLSEWSGIAGIDQAPTATHATTGATVTSPTVTPTVPGELVLLCSLHYASTASASPGSPWTDENGGTWYGGACTSVAYQVAPGTTGVSGSWTQTSGIWAALGVSFFAATAAAANSGFLGLMR